MKINGKPNVFLAFSLILRPKSQPLSSKTITFVKSLRFFVFFFLDSPGGLDWLSLSTDEDFLMVRLSLELEELRACSQERLGVVSEESDLVASVELLIQSLKSCLCSFHPTVM